MNFGLSQGIYTGTQIGLFQGDKININTGLANGLCSEKKITYPNIVTSGLLINVDANNPLSYRPPYNGSTWFDRGGLGNNGSLINSPTWNNSYMGSIVLNGVNNYVDFGTSSNIDITTGNFTLESFFYYQVSSITYAKIASKGYYLSGAGWVILAGNDGVNDIISFQYTNGGVWLSPLNVTISPNNWYHLVITRLSGVIRMYLNGRLIASYAESFNFSNPTQNTYIGVDGGVSEFFKGRISVFRQYSIGFTLNQVTQNYKAIKSTFGL